MGQAKSAALRACNKARSFQLPVGATPLISSCFGHFPFWYRHDDTSLAQNSEAAMTCFPFRGLTAPVHLLGSKAASRQRAADRVPFCNGMALRLSFSHTGDIGPCNPQNTNVLYPFQGRMLFSPLPPGGERYPPANRHCSLPLHVPKREPKGYPASRPFSGRKAWHTGRRSNGDWFPNVPSTQGRRLCCGPLLPGAMARKSGVPQRTPTPKNQKRM